MVEEIEEIEELTRRLAELRALRARVEQRQLEAGDFAVLGALLREQIAEVEAGGEAPIIELSEEEYAARGRTGGAVGAGDSTSEHASQGDASDGTRRPR